MSVSVQYLCYFLLSLVAIQLCFTLTSAQHSHDSESEFNCESDFYVLEKDLLSRSANRFNLTKAFFPPRDAHPVVVEIIYVFEGSEEITDVWFWSESMFYLIQPLDIFQYTSLFFSNLSFRKKVVTVTLSANCSGVDHEFLMILTQRMKLYSESATTSPTAETESLNENAFAVAVSRKDIEQNQVVNTFVSVWLHITLVLFPLGSWLVIYLCDPVHLLLGEHTWQKLEDEHTHGTIAALVQISVVFTTYVFVLDWIAVTKTITSDLLSYDKHPAFYLSTLTGLLIDVGAFLWMLFALGRNLHCRVWHCWTHLKNPNAQHVLKNCEEIKTLMTTVTIAPILCLANHFYYIVVAFISDPFHGGSIFIGHGISFFVYFLVFKQFYNRVVLRMNRRKSPQEKEKYCVNILHVGTSNHNVQNESTSTAVNGFHADQPKIRRKILRIPFNTLVVVLGLVLLTPLLILYEAVIITLIANLPISKLTEDAPSRLYALYQGTGILIVALLSYNILLRPNTFSFTTTIEKMAKELHIPQHYPKWNKFSNEEKVANVCVYLLRHKPIPSPACSEMDLRMRPSRLDSVESEECENYWRESPARYDVIQDTPV